VEYVVRTPYERPKLGIRMVRKHVRIPGQHISRFFMVITSIFKEFTKGSLQKQGKALLGLTRTQRTQDSEVEKFLLVPT
jgi:hypothetical protein